MSELSNQGRQRLRLLLRVSGACVCVIAMDLVLVFYGTPFDPVWWWVMAAVLAAAVVMVPALAIPIEWVIKGYIDKESG